MKCDIVPRQPYGQPLQSHLVQGVDQNFVVYLVQSRHVVDLFFLKLAVGLDPRLYTIWLRRTNVHARAKQDVLALVHFLVLGCHFYCFVIVLLRPTSRPYILLIAFTIYRDHMIGRVRSS